MPDIKENIKIALLKMIEDEKRLIYYRRVNANYLEENYQIQAEALQSCLTLWDPMDCSPPGSSGQGILQARILEWAAISISKIQYMLTKMRALLHLGQLDIPQLITLARHLSH